MPDTTTMPAPSVDDSLTASAPSPIRNIGSELVATALLMLAGPGVIVLTGTDDVLVVAVSFGAALAIALGVIGAVANPVLSLALAIVRDISPLELIEDWAGQFVGGIVGAAMIWGINDQTRADAGSNGWDRLGFGELGSVLIAELVFTIVLVVVFLSTISQGLSKSGIAAFTGLTYMVGHLVLLGISGGGMNPARSLGSAIFTNKSANDLAQVDDATALGQVWLFILVPLVAAVAGVFLWLAIDDAEIDDTIFDETFVDTLGDKIDGTVD